MGALREIRKKLRSIENIKKITQAMEMVAASRLRRAQAKAEKARPYASKLKNILDALVLIGDDLKHPLITKRAVKKVGLVIVSADRGLCGGYNNAIFLAAEKFLKDIPAKSVELILIGRKSIDHFSNKKWNVRKKIKEWGGKISFPEIKALSEELISVFLNGELDEIWIDYTQYVTLSSRKVLIEKFLNIDKPKPEKTAAPLNYILEPNASDIFADILPRYCITRVQMALDESYASELAARVLSMRAATKNAEEMMEKLTLKRNKMRQTGITREMIEIISGADSSNHKER